MTGRASPVRRVEADLGVVDGLVQLSFVVQSLLGRVMAEHGLSIVQARLLGVLRDREIGMLELSRILELEKSSVTGLVDRAERRGLVRRVAVPDNRRSVRVTLTPHGQDLARVGAERVAERIGELVAGLSPARRGRLAHLASELVFADAARREIPL
jgi:MarR family transcriptional regulator, lower aerobic nicotinate degradation pathway regulator